MPSISYDAQSFSIDGRRIWLLSGAMHYPRIPRALWRDRIRAAKQAGLNCIETYCFWNAHEPEPGRFDFQGNLDLRAFIEMIGQEGMFAIVRPGPYVCSEWDFGGLPAWLHREARDRKTGQFKVRQQFGPFMEAGARYLRAVMDQIKDLQITTPREGKRLPAPLGNVAGDAGGGFHAGLQSTCGGPIVLMQVENEWFCHNPDDGEAYLNEIARYLRENGAAVPLTVCNQLWQAVPNTIHTWNASANLAANLRQLAVVQPDAPRLASEYWTGWFDQWGGKHHDAVTPGKHYYRLAAILGAGAQANNYVFHGGTNFGFYAGRTINGKNCYMTTSYDWDAPLLEAGGRGEKFALTKRICTFTSHFGSLFAHLDPAPNQAAIAQDETDHPLSTLHLKGSQGQVLLILRSEKDRTTDTAVLLPDGISLPVHLGDDRAAWLLIDTNLAGVATLDFTNLRAFAFLDRRMLVLFGPAGSEGVVSLDGTPFHIKVPTGRQPAVETHGELTLVVLNEAMVDAAYPAPQGLVIGAGKLDQDNQPVPTKGWAKTTTVALDGSVTRTPANVPRNPRSPKISNWRHANCDALVGGTADAYQEVPGPASLEALGCDFGYGWYKLDIPHQALPTGRGKLLFPCGGDRLHVYTDGNLQAVLGPGADDEPASFKVATQVVVLADNLGRMNYGQHVGRDVKGIPHDLMQVKPVRMGKPDITDSIAGDPFVLNELVYDRRKGDQSPAQMLSWTVKPESRKPMILDINGLPQGFVLKVNDEPVGFYSPIPHAGFLRLVLDPAADGPFTGGKNKLDFHLYQPLGDDADLPTQVRLFQATGIITNKATWSFAPAPGMTGGLEDGAFAKGVPDKRVGRPMWYRASFNVSSTRTPLFLEPKGLSKGQAYLNGHNIGRYFVADEQGKPHGPQKRYYLPEPWLNVDEPNELALFDEHGHKPTGAKLVYRELGPWH